MKSVFLSVLVISSVSLMGCASLEDVRLKNRERLELLQLEISKKEAIKRMGKRTVRTYDPGYATARSVINNPYRSEAFQVGKDQYEILYYYTDLTEKDGAIKTDELTPLIIKNGKLIGWGRTFLDHEVAKYEKRKK